MIIWLHLDGEVREHFPWQLCPFVELTLLLCARSAGSYGSLARFRDVRRMQKVGENTLVAASGDLSDYQKIMKNVNEMQTYDMAHDDGCSMTPRDFHQYLGRVMYNR